MNRVGMERSLKAAKEKLFQTYERKGKTDREVWLLGEEVDRLLNEYDQWIKLNSTRKSQA